MTGEGEASLWFRLLVAALATWRITHLLALEDGPFDLLVRLRAVLGRAGRLLDCFTCLSIWIAAPLALFVTTKLSIWLCVWPALSGIACIVHRAIEPPVVIQPIEAERGDEHVVLRAETSGDLGQVEPEPPEPERDLGRFSDGNASGDANASHSGGGFPATVRPSSRS
jgi:hypothetical protein